jgi:GTPase SAR1 family protein
MLGPRSVGKTSLLAAMYQDFQNTVESTKLQMGVDSETAAVLQERLIDLKSLLRGGEGIPGTSGEIGLENLRKKRFVFRLGSPAKPPSLEVLFRDYPGGFLQSTASSEERAFVQGLVFRSAATLIPIDAPAMIEANGRWHEFTNRTMQVTEFVKLAFENLDEPRLVILAPTKCEKYMKQDQGLLAARVKEEYSDLLNFLRGPRLRDKVAVVITPVQTVGELVFTRVEMEGKHPRFFYKPLAQAKYKPVDCDQPLRHTLAFLLHLHLKQRQWGSFNFLRDLFGVDKHLREAMSAFSKQLKSGPGFEIIQGSHFLTSGSQP